MWLYCCVSLWNFHQDASQQCTRNGWGFDDQCAGPALIQPFGWARDHNFCKVGDWASKEYVHLIFLLCINVVVVYCVVGMFNRPRWIVITHNKITGFKKEFGIWNRLIDFDTAVNKSMPSPSQNTLRPKGTLYRYVAIHTFYIGITRICFSDDFSYV